MSLVAQQMVCPIVGGEYPEPCGVDSLRAHSLSSEQQKSKGHSCAFLYFLLEITWVTVSGQYDQGCPAVCLVCHPGVHCGRPVAQV